MLQYDLLWSFYRLPNVDRNFIIITLQSCVVAMLKTDVQLFHFWYFQNTKKLPLQKGLYVFSEQNGPQGCNTPHSYHFNMTCSCLKRCNDEVLQNGKNPSSHLPHEAGLTGLIICLHLFSLFSIALLLLLHDVWWKAASLPRLPKTGWEHDSIFRSLHRLPSSLKLKQKKKLNHNSQAKITNKRYHWGKWWGP